MVREMFTWHNLSPLFPFENCFITMAYLYAVALVSQSLALVTRTGQ